jgi:predicted transcriptional regulator
MSTVSTRWPKWFLSPVMSMSACSGMRLRVLGRLLREASAYWDTRSLGSLPRELSALEATQSLRSTALFENVCSPRSRSMWM